MYHKIYIIILVIESIVADATPSFGKIKSLHADTLRQHDFGSNRIVGGQEAEPHSIPYQVSFQETPWELDSIGNYTHFCGGSIIEKSTVLTSAYCCFNMYPPAVTVVVGAHDISQEEPSQQRLTIKDVIVHDNFSFYGSENDICIVRLAEPIIMTEEVKPVKLAEAESNFTGQGMISGWGLTGLNEPAAMQPKLRNAKVPLLSDEECRDRLSFDLDLYVYDSNICAGGSGTSPCVGDQGGPLMCGDEQCGIASWGVDCEIIYPYVFTEISYFRNWIANPQ